MGNAWILLIAGKTDVPFNLDDWKRRMQHNSEEAERNSSMDSGWSKSVADTCLLRACQLWRELAVAIAETETKSEDFFDRPDLVAIQEAARSATKPHVECGQ